MTSHSIASSNQCHSINKSGLISGVMELSNCDTTITKSLEVQNNDFGKEKNNKKLAEVRFGKQNTCENERNTNVILANNGELIQHKNGHIHVFNHMDICEGATVFTTKYNPNHIKKFESNKTLIKDHDLTDKNTAGFDIHGNEKDINSGFVKFHKGSNIKLASNNIKVSIKTNGQTTSGQNNGTTTVQSTTTNTQTNSQYTHDKSCKCCSCCCCVETHTTSGSSCHTHTSGNANNQASEQTSGGTQHSQTYGHTSTNGTNNLYPALYLCNDNSRLDISEVLKKTYKSSYSNEELDQNFKVHIVGTTDEYGNRQGTIDIFDISGNDSDSSNSCSASNFILSNIYAQLDIIGNNDVLCENVKLNIPSYKIRVIDENGNMKDINSQRITITALEHAENIGTEQEPMYDTVNKTSKFTGMTINLVNSQGNYTAEFIPGDLIKILLNSYIDNDNPEYTLLKKKGTEGDGTGIKIIPQINESNIDEIFGVHYPNAKITNIKFGNTDMRVTIPEFIRSIKLSNNENLKLIVGQKSDNSEYVSYGSQFLNDQQYTLDLDKFNNINTIPFKLNPQEQGIEPYIDMDGYNDSDILPLYVNLKGSTNKKLKLPTKSGGEENQINEIDFFGNNTKFTNVVELIENDVSSESDTYVKKIVFDNDSYIKTNILSKNFDYPITWKFIGSNQNVHQNQDVSKYYASNINKSLSLMVLDHVSDKERLSVNVNDPTKNKSVNGGFNSYIYVDEIFFTSTTDSNNSTQKPKTSFAVSNNSTVRLVNREYANAHPYSSLFGTRIVLMSHIDSNFSIQKYDESLDSILIYSPMEKFLKTTVNLNTQLQSYKYASSGVVEFHVAIDKEDFPSWTSFLNHCSQHPSFLLDIIVQKDENNKNKMQFYNMIEYIYCPEFNNGTKANVDLVDKPHIYIPLFMKQSNDKCYYYVTNFEVFPGYTRDSLKTNFMNATKSLKNASDIIPSIYIGGQKIQTRRNINILFSNTNNCTFRDSKYLVFVKDKQL